MSKDWTEADIPDQTGRTVLITGANSGIGFEAARALAGKGADVVMACRNRAKAEQARTRIDDAQPAGSTEVLVMDLADLDSVRAGVGEFLGRHDRLDVLVNNAGLMWTPKGTTEQGFETQFGVNHLGHFALTGHLLGILQESGASRVVTISSTGHRPGKIHFDDLQSEEKYSPYGAYFQSKLANLLFTRELQKRLSIASSETIAVAAHPGGSDTNLGHENAGGVFGTVVEKTRPVLDKYFSQSAQMGALPTLRAATDANVTGGNYFGPGGFMEMRGHPVNVGMSKRAKDDAVAVRLWDVSEDLTGVVYEF